MERYQEVLTTALTSPSQIYLAFTALTSCLRRSQRVLILPLPTTAHNIYTAEQKVCVIVKYHYCQSITIIIVYSLSESFKAGASRRCLCPFPHKLSHVSS